MRTIYLSPHLDDAILSCGGLISDQIEAEILTEVWTIMAGTSKPEKEIQKHYAKRREEDRLANKEVGSYYVHYNYVEAPERGYTNVFLPVDDRDNAIISAIADRINGRLLPDDTIMCPLAVGKHVDHVVVRLAAEMLNRPLTYYVDFPYVEYVPHALPPATEGLVSRVQPISKKGLVRWRDAVKQYKSQDLYATQEITYSKITMYWADVCGIYLWNKEA